MKKISVITTVLLVLLFSCQKDVEKKATQEEIPSATILKKDLAHLQQTKTYSADVVPAHRLPTVQWLIAVLRHTNL